MKVELRPEFHIVESCGMLSVVPVGDNGKGVGSWHVLYAPSLGEGSHRPHAGLTISNPGGIGSADRWCRGEDWKVLSHKMFRARRWPSPWQVVK